MTQPRFVVFFCAVFLGACTPETVRLPDYPMSSPQLSAVDLQLPLHGTAKSSSLSEYRGKVVVLDVWATWCEPCRESLSALQQKAGEWPSDHVAVVTVNIDDEDEGVEPFLRELDITLPVLRDPGAESLAKRFRFTEAPTTYLIGPRGRIRQIYSGVTGDSWRRMLAQVELMLTEETTVQRQ